MQKLILLFMALFSFLNIIAQNCNLNDEAKRHMLKAEGMRETMQTTDDMQLVANEYEQAAQAAPYCPDIYYNLGLCYEELGKKQPELFDKAVACYQKYLQLSPSAENKSDVENLIYKIEGKKEMAQKQMYEKWVGKWNCHFVATMLWGPQKIRKGDPEEFDVKLGRESNGLSFEIFVSEGNLYAKVLSYCHNTSYVPTSSNPTGNGQYNFGDDLRTSIVPVILQNDYIMISYDILQVWDALYNGSWQAPYKTTFKRKFNLHLTSPNRLEGEWLGNDDPLMNGFWSVDSFYFYKE